MLKNEKSNQRATRDQYGFRKNKETREAILSLRILIER